MNKIVVIDGLARSGTTLLSSMIHSQSISKCYRGMFHEFLACDIGRWKRDYSLYPLIKKDETIKIVDDFSKFSNSILFLKKNLPNIDKIQNFTSINLSLKQFKENSLDVIKKKNQTDKLTYKEWYDLINSYNFKNFNDLDNFYQELSKILSVNFLGFRWNQGYPYCLKWLRNENHYWISVIRHPISRSLSDNKTFNESLKLGIKYSINFGNIIGHIDHPRHIKIYFDDLILDPKKTMIKIFKSVGLPLKKVNLNLIQQSGENYKVESSDIITKNNAHYNGRKFEGFEKNKLVVNYNGISRNVLEKYKKIINKYSIYQPYRENSRFYNY